MQVQRGVEEKSKAYQQEMAAIQAAEKRLRDSIISALRG
jgi:hypothetical protein